MKEKQGITTVTIDRSTGVQLDRLSSANGVTKKDFLSAALSYFEKYGINPVGHESPAQEMQKLIKRVDQVIAFMKVQERDMVKPMFEAMSEASSRMNLTLDGLATVKQVTKLSKEIEQQGNGLKSHHKDMRHLMQVTSAREEKALAHISWLIDAKGKSGVFKDLSRLYEETKREYER